MVTSFSKYRNHGENDHHYDTWNNDSDAFISVPILTAFGFLTNTGDHLTIFSWFTNILSIVLAMMHLIHLTSMLSWCPSCIYMINTQWNSTSFKAAITQAQICSTIFKSSDLSSTEIRCFLVTTWHTTYFIVHTLNFWNQWYFCSS